ncbi:hypothetical protein BpHYR1_052748 [Brachionus plicatilis]|uniref:Uncharacterized protein n=1 Tax=Brachionus plicatilis TaxID=10195 RepID=A0A3M7R8C1_BRAPC|nr:hypothetical protein BpHYR1_052748 [Brachionus plicatilis]
MIHKIKEHMSGINRDLIGHLKIVYKWEVSSEVLFTKVTKRWRFSRYYRSKHFELNFLNETSQCCKFYDQKKKKTETRI